MSLRFERNPSDPRCVNVIRDPVTVGWFEAGQFRATVAADLTAAELREIADYLDPAPTDEGIRP